MRKSCWQRWVLMFLLVSRLVIGEFGHAMPMSHPEGHFDGSTMDMGMGMGMDAAHHEMSDAISSVATDASACAEQEGSNPAHTSHHCGDSSADGASGAQDCCQSGECECPCLHVPCAALDTLVLNPVATTSLRISRGVEGLVSQRPSGLFRPPARIS